MASNLLVSHDYSDGLHYELHEVTMTSYYNPGQVVYIISVVYSDGTTGLYPFDDKETAMNCFVRMAYKGGVKDD